MPNLDEEKKCQNAHDDPNPFVLFRRFADHQISTLVNGILSISSSFGSPSTSPHRSIQDYEKCLQEPQESSRRFIREAEEAGRIMDVYTKAHKDGQHTVQESSSDRDSEPLKCPYRPAGQEKIWPEKLGLDICLADDATCSCLSLAAFGLRLPNTVLATPMLGEQPVSVPVAYLLYSPYSPVRLEQQPHLCDQGSKWREAFEDLLAVQSGQELPAPRCLQRTPVNSAKWVRGMVDLAMCNREGNPEASSLANSTASNAMEQLPGLLSRFRSAEKFVNDAGADEYEDGDNDDLVEEDEAETTEMDAYNSIFSSQQPSSNDITRAAAQSFAQSEQDSSPSNTGRVRPSILSTLTTMERTTLQDGSVHTKIVLKKRFSDGREQSTETVHHQNAAYQVQDAASKSTKAKDVGETGKDKGNKENKASGWFWS